MKDAILQLLREQDSFAAIEFASRQPDPLAVVVALDELMRDLYWKQKDRAASAALGRAAAQFALATAIGCASDKPELAVQLRGKAKALCYNLASFTWSGWGEEGPPVTPFEEAIGLDAARANLRLGRELNRGDLAISRGWWMLGAQQISARDYGAALESFAHAQRLAKAANEVGDELLSAAFARLTEFFADRSDRAKFDGIAVAIRELSPVKDGPFFAKQVVTALGVFYPECEGLETLKHEVPES